MDTSWINRDLFPFSSRFVPVDGHQLHYVDEGTGPVILFVHGTPEWSFGWRDLIAGLKDRYRCIAVDHLGFGLSDKPARGDYRVEAHANRLLRFTEALNLKAFHLIANDFGLSIGLSVAIRHPERVQKISLFNGWMWPLSGDPHYAGPAKVMRTWLGRLMYLRFNFPVNVVMPSAFGDRRKLTPEVHRHYKRALPTPASRVAAYAFAPELLDAEAFWQSLWEQRDRLADKPFLLFWGLKDRFVPPYELAKWEQALPNATVVRYPNAGHFVQEEEPEDMVARLRVFLG